MTILDLFIVEEKKKEKEKKEKKNVDLLSVFPYRLQLGKIS